MASSQIVKAINVVADGLLGVCPCLKPVAVNQLFLDGRVKRFDAGIVIGISFSTHADSEVIRLQAIDVIG